MQKYDILVYNIYRDDYMETENIILLENINKYLKALKYKIKDIKPPFFEKKKLNNYYNLIRTLENQINKIDNIISEYKKNRN